MTLFVNHTVRSSDQLLGDLADCRQFRHLRAEQLQPVLDETAERLRKSRDKLTLKHPDPENPCTNCGEPRSKINMGAPGLCWRCYVGKVCDFWVEDVFSVAIDLHGLSCDACGTTFEVDEGYRRQAAMRCNHNLEGSVRPVLCPSCTQDFKGFMSRNFGRAWRRASSGDQDKMALAWLAQKVKVLAERVKREAA